MPLIEIKNTLDVLHVSERYLVEEFIEGDALIFEAKFETGSGKDRADYLKEAKNFTYSLNISAGSNPLSCRLNGPIIDIDTENENCIIASWTWDTTGVRPGTYEAEALITGPEDVHICPKEKPLAKAVKITRP